MTTTTTIEFTPAEIATICAALYNASISGGYSFESRLKAKVFAEYIAQTGDVEYSKIDDAISDIAKVHFGNSMGYFMDLLCDYNKGANEVIKNIKECHEYSGVYPESFYANKMK